MAVNEKSLKNLQPNVFDKDNQPSREAKSEGKKKWWRERKIQEESRNKILGQLYKLAGLDNDGEYKLEEMVAEKMLDCLQKGELKQFLDLYKEVMPDKKAELNMNIGGQQDNPVEVRITHVKAKQ